MQGNDNARNICLGFWGFLNANPGSKFLKPLNCALKPYFNPIFCLKPSWVSLYTQVYGSILTCIRLNIPQVTPKWGVNFWPKTAKNGNFCQNRLLGLKYPPEVLVELKTCSTICGTHVHTILHQKIWPGRQWGSGKVKIWPKITPILPLIAPYSDLPWPPLSTRAIFFGSKWCVHVSRI